MLHASSHNIKVLKTFRIPWKFNFYLDDPEFWYFYITVSYGLLKEFMFEQPSLKTFNALRTKEQFLIKW